jgi:hypothetical protein
MTYRDQSNSASNNAFVRKENSGALFKNQKKEQPQHSDYTGELDVNGVQYWLSAWIRESKNGTRFLSLAVKEKGQRKAEASKPFNDSIGF